MGRVICITGGIGSGKSSVARLMSAYCNVPCIDIDECCKELLCKGHRGWHALQNTYGNVYFNESGHVDRKRLREALFSDPELREQLDSLLHPIARRTLLDAIEQYDDQFLLVEVPLVYEAGWDKDFDAIVVVAVDREKQIQRTITRDGVDEEQARQSVDAQMELEKKVNLADYIVDNNGAWADTRNKVVDLCLLLEREIGLFKKKNLTV
ncbi:dephospho-CoA kinase [Desulfogranum japonicum]|uniref:dephospho-CoA kinase n=1 Tax=Desulfogranum japonicum TaxID=231447 RepID=UPI0004293B7F|nr:dephospho-CoA kinase [Desulfogranum japonicum]